MPGTLYLVATPIGNLQDMTFRAVEVLKSVDVIACEDTRHTRKLLNAFEIENKLVSYHDHNESERSDELVKLLEGGNSVAVVSDAGTPGINDPGYRIVQAARMAGADVVPIPGAVAFVNAVVASGLPTDSLFFGGFLPSKTGERRRRLEELREMPATLVFYEAPHRLAASLRDCREVLGNRRASVARELTKLHEEIVTGTFTELIERFDREAARGEIVLTIERVSEMSAPTEASETTVAVRYRELIDAGSDRKAAMKAVAKEFGLPRDKVYRLVQNIS
jgi:16S rRNA (cytidine1402-2'-O)-methyltransferase